MELAFRFFVDCLSYLMVTFAVTFVLHLGDIFQSNEKENSKNLYIAA